MSASLSGVFNLQCFDDAGLPLASGRLYTYAPNTTTQKVAYTDPAGTIPHTYTSDGLGGQYIALNSRGELPAPLFLLAGGYDIALKTSAGVTVWTRRAIGGDDVADTRRADLANPSDATKGDALIGVKQPLSGAVSRTQHDKNADWVSVTDFGAHSIDEPGYSTFNSTAAFLAAMAVSRHVWIPEGRFKIDGLPINRNYVTLRGAGMYATQLVMSATAAVALELGSTGNVSFVTVEDLTLLGNATALGGVKLGTASNYAAGILFRNVFITDFTNASAAYGYGVQFCSNQNTQFDNCWVQNNSNCYHRVTGGFCTSTLISGKRSYIGLGVNNGFLIEGQIDDLSIVDAVIEGNLKEAIEVKNTAVAVGRGCRIWIEKCYFEANLNGGSGAGVIHAVGAAGAYQLHKISVDSCTFAADSNAPVGYKKVSFDYVQAVISDSTLIPNEIALTNTCITRFEANKYPNAGNYLAGYKALLGNVVVADFTDPAVGTDPNQVNLVNALTFPTTPRRTTDLTTLDDFRRGTYTPTAANFGGTVSSTAAKYTKVGNRVFFEITIVGSNLVSTWTGSRASLPFPSNGVGVAVVINADTGTSYGNAYISNGATDVLLPTWTSIATANMVIAGSYTTDA